VDQTPGRPDPSEFNTETNRQDYEGSRVTSNMQFAGSGLLLSNYTASPKNSSRTMATTRNRINYKANNQRQIINFQKPRHPRELAFPLTWGEEQHLGFVVLPKLKNDDANV